MEKRIAVLVTEANSGTTTEPTLRELSAALIAANGTDYGIPTLVRISRFTNMVRQAAAHRNKRILLAGDSRVANC